jgi:uncharacterized membrane protein
MPDISAFCPSCGRSISSEPEVHAAAPADAVLGAVAYVGVLPAIAFLLIPAIKQKSFVRFHSWQSLLFAGATLVIGIVGKVLFLFFSILPGIGYLFSWLSMGILSIAVFVIWVVLLVKAATGRGYELPVIGPFATQLAR